MVTFHRDEKTVVPALHGSFRFYVTQYIAPDSIQTLDSRKSQRERAEIAHFSLLENKQLQVLRGGIVNRTYGIHKNIYI